ncbi:transporter [Pseudoxanthomonas sp. PXM04]|uniref:transporter n=1 Tax=Pseudoxanthomonas sp. PXM04 TaxID=2769297 RepID=UPI00177B7320|nr:transporter [Pseudoxanthomonas sp. PXM04]MBD9377548.1 transporter [Pseudoxanthomonas sp. PXM04]
MRGFLFAAAWLATAPVLASEPRDLCPDRPGLGTPACTVERGDTVFEIGLADWTRDSSPGLRSEQFLIGDALLRFGLNDTLEAQVGWTAYGRVRERDTLSGATTRASRFGDVSLALRQNLRNPDGGGFSLALMPYVNLPSGRKPVGAEDWSAGLRLPMSIELGAVSLGFTPQIEAAVDGDGDGRHLSYGSVAGLGFGVSDAVSGSFEVSLIRDRDRAGHVTEALAGLSFGWQHGEDAQWDAGVNAGLNDDSPDVQIYVGYARRFR